MIEYFLKNLIVTHNFLIEDLQNNNILLVGIGECALGR